MKDIIDSDINELETSAYNLLYFTASWCGPCRQIKPYLIDYEKQLSDNSENITIYKVDVDNNEELCSKLEVKGVPAFYLYHGKLFIGKCVGANIDQVKELVSKKDIIT